MKKVSLLVVICLLLSCLLAVPAGAQEPVTVTMIMQGDNVPPPENDVLLEIEARTGIRPDIIYTPSADYEAKLSALIAAGTLPDLFSFKSTDAVEFIDSGMVMEISGLLEEYAPNILADVGERLYMAPINEPGQVYGIVASVANFPNSLHIRTDWLENLGMEMPTDLDSLYDVLYAFTYDDPDGNGVQDTYGLGGLMSWNNYQVIFGAYGIPLGFPVELEDGTITTWLKHPRTLEAIEYMRGLYSEGLMEPDFATIPQMSSFETLWTGKVGAYGWTASGVLNNWMPSRYTEDPPPTFDVATIVGPYGDFGSPASYASLTDYWGVASTSQNPEAAVRLMDFMKSEEGDELLYLGVEGKHFNWTNKENGEYEMIPPYDDSAEHRNAGAFVYWNGTLRPQNHTANRIYNRQTREAIALAMETALDYPYVVAALNADAEYKGVLEGITQEAFAGLIVTKGDVQAEYDAFIQRWENEGGLIWEEEATAAYQEQK